jgi:hypothetical protein
MNTDTIGIEAIATNEENTTKFKLSDSGMGTVINMKLVFNPIEQIKVAAQ